jgi:hypothetical protein
VAARRSISRGALALVATIALALASCGGDSEPDDAEPLGDELVGSVAQLAQCSDWVEGNRSERLATIEDVREQINVKDGTGETPELSDDVAYGLFQRTCANDYAQSFRLYKIYARATAFAGFTEPQ